MAYRITNVYNDLSARWNVSWSVRRAGIGQARKAGEKPLTRLRRSLRHPVSPG